MTFALTQQSKSDFIEHVSMDLVFALKKERRFFLEVLTPMRTYQAGFL